MQRWTDASVAARPWGAPSGGPGKPVRLGRCPGARPMDPDARRRHLLASARRVFARQGYHRTSVSDLIREAGVARGTFYNYFESKRAVFQEVLVELSHELSAAASPIDVLGDIPAQVRANFASVIRAAMAPEAARLLFGEAVGIDAEPAAALLDLYDDATFRIADALQKGQRLGIVRDGDRQLAELLIGMVKSPVHIATLRGRSSTRIPVDEVLAMLSTGMLGVGPL